MLTDDLSCSVRSQHLIAKLRGNTAVWCEYVRAPFESTVNALAYSFPPLVFHRYDVSNDIWSWCRAFAWSPVRGIWMNWPSELCRQADNSLNPLREFSCRPNHQYNELFAPAQRQIVFDLRPAVVPFPPNALWASDKGRLFFWNSVFSAKRVWLVRPDTASAGRW